jgi:hypothetical protein
MKRFCLALFMICLGFSARPGVAAIIFSQSTNTTTAVGSDFDFGVAVPSAGALEAGDDFMLGSTATLKSVSWFGGYNFTSLGVPASDNFVINLYVDNGSGNPVATPFASFAVGNAVNRADTGADFTALVGFSEFSYSANVADTVLAAGTKYYVSIVNDTSAVSGGQWAWSFSGVSDLNHWRRSNSTGNVWSLTTFPSASRSSLAFALSDTGVGATAVPEPVSLALWCLSSLVCIAGKYRRRRN